MFQPFFQRCQPVLNIGGVQKTQRAVDHVLGGAQPDGRRRFVVFHDAGNEFHRAVQIASQSPRGEFQPAPAV